MLRRIDVPVSAGQHGMVPPDRLARAPRRRCPGQAPTRRRSRRCKVARDAVGKLHTCGGGIAGANHAIMGWASAATLPRTAISGGASSIMQAVPGSGSPSERGTRQAAPPWRVRARASSRLHSRAGLAARRAARCPVAPQARRGPRRMVEQGAEGTRSDILAADETQRVQPLRRQRSPAVDSFITLSPSTAEWRGSRAPTTARRPGATRAKQLSIVFTYP